MKKPITFLLTLLFGVNALKAAPTDLPQMTTDLENPVYYIISNTRSTSGRYVFYAGDEVGLADANEITEASLFYFTGTIDACYIHNAATTKRVASVTSWTDTGIEWAINVTPYGDGTTGLSIGPKGHSGSGCWNESNYNNRYTTFAANDPGSIFVIEPYENGKVYTIEVLGTNGGGVIYANKEYTDGDTIQNKGFLENSDFTAVAVGDMISIVSVDGTTISVSYMDALTKFYTLRGGHGGYVSLGEGYHDNTGLLLNNTAIPMDKKGLWTFVEADGGGYKIYNYSTGLSKVVGMTGSEGSARAAMVSPDATTHTILFDGAINFDGTASYIKLKDSEHNYWNKRGNYLALWNSAGASNGDVGSMFYLNESDYTIEELTSVNPEDYPEEQLFLIMNAAGNNYLTANTSITIDARDEANGAQCFYFIRTGTPGQYHLKSSNGKFVKSAHGNSWTVTAVAEPSDNTLHEIKSVGDGVYTIGMVNSSYVIGPDYTDNGSGVYSDKSVNQNCKWYILLAESDEVPVRVGTEFVNAGLYYRVTSTIENTVEVIPAQDGYRGDIVIPETVTYGTKTYSVTSIAENAFNNCTEVTTLSIPRSVTSIGDYAFSGCAGDDLVVCCNIPSASSYYKGAFYNSRFSKVAFEEGVTSIGDYAFSSNYNLTTVVLPKDLNSIGTDAFSGCNNLHTVINYSSLPLSVGSYEYGSVACYAERVLQGEAIVTIGDYLFCDGVLVAYLGNEGEVTLPQSYNDGIYAIGNKVFYDNTRLTSVTIPEGVTSIGNYTFYGCNKLNSIIIPEGVTYIGEYAFYNCKGLMSLTIPESVEAIGRDAFRYCTGEVIVNCNIPSASSYSRGVFYDSDFSIITIGGGVAAIGDYAFYNCNNLVSVTLPGGLRSIGNSSFKGCNRLTSIDIPKDVAEIGNNAFNGCSSLTSVAIPEGVTSIKNETFSGCSKLNTVNLPKNITEIGANAFFSCNSLSSLDIPESVISIGEYAFYYCSNLLSVTLPNGVASVSEYAFYGCENLASITLPEGVATIGSNAFSCCYSLSSIDIPNNVTSIGDYAFNQCRSLTSIVVPKGVSYINNYTFYSCEKLTSVTLPEGIISIGNNAFSNCSKLSSIVIPESVTNIGSSAFYNCDSLVSMAIPENVTSIGTYAFEGCNSLVSVTIPDKVKTLDRYLFQNCSALATVTVGTGVETIRSYVLYNCNLNALLCYAIIPPSIQSNSFYQSTISAIYVPSASVELYRAADVWKDYNILAISDYTANLLTVSYEYGVGVTTVSLDASLNNSKIYYTLDGSDPLSAGILYEAPFEVNSACTLKAIAVCSGFENSNLIDERIVIKNMPTISNFSLSYTRDITYDGAPHDVYVYASNGMGEITLVYRDANGMESTEAPSAVGKYDVSISVAEGPLFYAASFENVASFTISVMDEVEWNTLQELYVQTNGASQWTRKWDMSGGIAAAASFYGVTYRNGHVVELSLSNRNLVGQLPISVLALPYLERLNLSGNQLTGDLGSLVAGTESISNLSYIDISNNRFSGNIGTIVTCCPKLEYLYAAHNYISEVSPALPEDLYVSLSSQTVEDMLVWDGGVSAENGEDSLPSILTYSHRNQNYSSADWVVEKAWDENLCWSIGMGVDAECGSMELSAQAVNYVYYGNSGDTLDVTASATMTASGSKAKMIYRFGQGDANFSGDVNVLDVQSTINFIFKEHQYYPFNHTAANVQNVDTRVNVLDVIALIDQLMAENLSVESLARARAKGRAAMAADAYLYWEGNRLILETEKEVAALDIVLQETNSLQWNESLGMTMTSSAQNGYQRAIAYSLSGRYIPIGKHVLLTSQPCDIASVLVADRAAQKIGVALKASETTGIEKENTERLHCRQQGSWVQLIVDAEYDQLVWEAYTTAGCLMGSGILEDVTEGIVNLFATDSKRTMIVVVRDNNGIVLTQKLK